MGYLALILAIALTILGSASATSFAYTSTSIGGTSVYNVTSGDAVLMVNSALGALRINLPSASPAGRAIIVCDATCSAGTNPVSIYPTGSDVIGPDRPSGLGRNCGTITFVSTGTGRWLTVGSG